MLRHRWASRDDKPCGFTASAVSFVMSNLSSWYGASELSSSGFFAYPALPRLRSLNAALSTMTVPPTRRSFSSTVRAAGFMATSTSTSSPGVMTSTAPNWIWNAETPNVVPAGARISAGKSGNVERSFPARAVSRVNCVPVTCIPSPESPANRITTESRISRAGDEDIALEAINLEG